MHKPRCSHRHSGVGPSTYASTFVEHIQQLEVRRMLSGATKGPKIIDYTDPSKSHIVELAPETIDPKTGISPPSNRRVADPADIIWVNRGASDGFDTVFGTFAATARG